MRQKLEKGLPPAGQARAAKRGKERPAASAKLKKRSQRWSASPFAR